MLIVAAQDQACEGVGTHRHYDGAHSSGCDSQYQRSRERPRAVLARCFLEVPARPFVLGRAEHPGEAALECGQVVEDR